jgi:hypothetical protein
MVRGLVDFSSEVQPGFSQVSATGKIFLLFSFYFATSSAILGFSFSGPKNKD